MGIPKLRFKEFNKSWVKKKLGEVSVFLDGKRKPIKENDRSKMRGQYPYYGASGIIDYVNNYIFDGEIILLGEDGENIVSRNLPLAFKVTGKCWVNNHAHVIVPKQDTNIDFLTQTLERTNYEIYNTGTAQPKLNQEVCRNIPLNFPSLPEQQKIASFLSAVDEKIQQLTRKKELLEQYKKGVMQQLFSSSELGLDRLKDDRINPSIQESYKSKFRQLRFKDENGKDYPKWEEKTMFDISENVSYGMNAAAIEYDGKHKYIRITDIDENSGKFNPSPLSSPDGEIEDRFKLKEGDIVFARTGASVGKAYLYNQNDGELYYAGFLIKFSIVGANPFFIYSLTQRYEYDKWVHVYSMRSGQPGLNAEEYKALKLKLPCLEEQQKIASFLTALDAKIESVATQITHTQTFKKGLLQQMFV